MDKQYESVYHDEEERNWWFVTRRDMIKKLFSKYKIPKNAHIIDIGCAGGALLVELKAMGYENLYALDYSAEAIALCKKRGIEHAYEMDGHDPQFPENTFDLVIASDSLEHLSDDMKALHSWHRILKPGGKAFVFVPAYQFLWSEHDDINFHFRRYTRTNLVGKLKQTGFKILLASYWNFLLFFPTAAMRLVGKLKKKKELADVNSDLVHLPDTANKLLIGMVNMENVVNKIVPFPFGVSTYAVVSK